MSDELTRRQDAIALSGWGAPFRFVQPQNACFWVYLAVVGAGAWHLVSSVSGTASVFAQANIAAVLSSGAFAIVFLLFLHWADRWERTPGLLAVAAFVVGGVGATAAIAITGNAAMMSLYTKLFGQAWAQDWKAGLTAPFVEETAKGAGFLLLMGLAPVVIRTVYDAGSSWARTWASASRSSRTCCTARTPRPGVSASTRRRACSVRSPAARSPGWPRTPCTRRCSRPD